MVPIYNLWRALYRRKSSEISGGSLLPRYICRRFLQDEFHPSGTNPDAEKDLCSKKHKMLTRKRKQKENIVVFLNPDRLFNITKYCRWAFKPAINHNIKEALKIIKTPFLNFNFETFLYQNMGSSRVVWAEFPPITQDARRGHVPH